MHDVPPPALDYARVVAYAVVDDSVEWTGRQRLFVNEVLLGPVSRLAIAQNLFGDRQDLLLFHCNDEWTVLGVVVRASIQEIKDAAEGWYSGIGARWIDVANTPESAESWIRAQETTVSCSFCDKFPPQVESMAFGKNACICNECTKRLYEELSSGSEAGSAA
jgi:hypothetical protein